ncbi:MAG: 50S ribosomal protein L30e, partial [archaeon]|nr:50S ribosomal protein L30e [archaeon]
KVLFGVKQTQDALRHGEGKLVVMAQNTPGVTKEGVATLATLLGIPTYAYLGNGLELGSVCGKPFVVSTLLVLEEGKSNVLTIPDTSTSEDIAPKRKGRKKKGA